MGLWRENNLQGPFLDFMFYFCVLKESYRLENHSRWFTLEKEHIMTTTNPLEYDFRPFGKAVHDQYTSMSKSADGVLVTSAVDSDALWAHYLASFPEGTDPIFRVRSVHDCSCCRNYVKNLGNTVLVKNGKIITVWDDCGKLDFPYNIVGTAMAEFIRNHGIETIFRRGERSYGNLHTRDGKDPIVWSHFHGSVETKHFEKGSTQTGSAKVNAQVMRRGLEELSPASVAIVAEMIKEDLIYRGAEHAESVKSFQKLQSEYLKKNSRTAKDIFIWENLFTKGALFRNTVIGSLVTDISEGIDVEKAVASFEAKVAPANYKRPKAIVTKKMIDDALKTIDDLGVEDALYRRMAQMSDVTINNVIWASRAAKGQMRGGIGGLMLEEASKVSGVLPKEAKASVVMKIEDFIKDIVPDAEKLRIAVDDPSKMFVLTAASAENAPNIFKWNNNFGWSYAGGLADSDIKARVQKAGGRVTNAAMRFSLAWNNSDDLDIHVTPPNGKKIYFGNPSGILDVDMNAWNISPKPVENCSWMKTPADGLYKIFVHNFRRRTADNQGFQVEIESQGSTMVLECDTNDTRDTAHTINVTVKNGTVVDVKHGKAYKSSGGFKWEKWGTSGENWHEVSTMLYSPNYWDENAVGNKHYFFVSEDVVCDEEVRGIYNEFLKPEFGDKHRRVFEMLGNKTKCPVIDHHLAGFGFSSTRRDSVLVEVTKGKRVQIMEIQF